MQGPGARRGRTLLGAPTHACAARSRVVVRHERRHRRKAAKSFPPLIVSRGPAGSTIATCTRFACLQYVVCGSLALKPSNLPVRRARGTGAAEAFERCPLAAYRAWPLSLHSAGLWTARRAAVSKMATARVRHARDGERQVRGKCTA